MRPSHVDHIPELLARFDNRRVNLEPILEAIWNEYTYLPDDAVHQVAVKLQIPAAEVVTVARRLKQAQPAPVAADF